MSNTSFMKCKGGILLQNEPNTLIFIKNSTFDGNSANYGPVSLFLRMGSRIYVNDVTFRNNRAVYRGSLFHLDHDHFLGIDDDGINIINNTDACGVYNWTTRRGTLHHVDTYEILPLLNVSKFSMTLELRDLLGQPVCSSPQFLIPVSLTTESQTDLLRYFDEFGKVSWTGLSVPSIANVSYDYSIRWMDQTASFSFRTAPDCGPRYYTLVAANRIVTCIPITCDQPEACNFVPNAKCMDIVGFSNLGRYSEYQR